MRSKGTSCENEICCKEANGGAGITFSTTSPGRATVTINSEDEVSFSISDAAGRSVMSGKLNNYRGSGATAANTIASWSCQLHDATTNLSGYGTLLVTTSIDAIGNATKTWTDAAGRTIRSLDQLDKVTAVTYDAGGNQLIVRDPNNVGADMVYDNLGKNTQSTDTLGDVIKTEYDRAGNAGRMTSRNYRTLANSPSGTIADTDTFTFDRAGRMLTAVSGRYTNTVGYTFDPVGRKASEALTISGQTYTVGTAYNARNELTSYTFPDSSTSTRTYHATGALNQLNLDGSTVSTRTYDNGRRQTSEVLGNGITETRVYRTDNLLSTISYSDTSIGNLAYSWDANKNKTAETIGGAMSGYGFTAAGTTYDFEDRLTGYQRAATSGSALLSQSWSLTTVGDWSSVTTNGTAQTRTHGPTHELLTAGGQAVTTDVKGNTTLLPSTLSSSPLNLSYDFDNKMKSVDVDANSSVDVEYKYDVLGRRVARVGSSGSLVYVQADQQTIADYGVGDAPASPLYRYVYASYIDEPVVRKEVGTSGTLHYYHRNQQYSIYAITTAAGAIAERYAYTAYGQPTILSAAAAVLTSSAINNRYTYTAREWDNTIGLHHFRARWMSGLTGRFLTRDPIKYRGGICLYASPLKHSTLDPLGLKAYTLGDDPKKGPDTKVPPVVKGDPPAAPVCVHNTPGKKRCYFPMFSNDDIDDIFEDMGGNGGILEDVAPFQKGSHHATPEGKKKILKAIKDRGCCEVIFAGHQGGKGNAGGICSKSPDDGGVIPLFPDQEFERELAAIFKQNCPSGCDVFQYSCAGRDPDDPDIPEKRRKIAQNLGCTFWAVEPGVQPPIRRRNPKPPAGQGQYCSFDPTEWQPDPQKSGWCVPFPMVPYKPGFSR